jgi:hypothetical protein
VDLRSAPRATVATCGKCATRGQRCRVEPRCAAVFALFRAPFAGTSWYLTLESEGGGVARSSGRSAKQLCQVGRLEPQPSPVAEGGGQRPVTVQEPLRVDRGEVCDAAFTGLRQSELIGLRWKDVGVASQRIRVRNAVVRGQHSGEGKSDLSTRRSVPMTERLRAELERWHARTVFDEETDLVFAHPQQTGFARGPSRRRAARTKEQVPQTKPGSRPCRTAATQTFPSKTGSLTPAAGPGT